VKRTPLRRKVPMRRTRLRQNHPHRSVRFEASALHEAVTRRSRGICELCRDAPASEMHHRRMRSAGGLDIVDNILHLCRSCHHDTIHANPDWAYRHGFLLRRAATDHPEPVIGCWSECTMDHYA
jgi:hypothetical protein